MEQESELTQLGSGVNAHSRLAVLEKAMTNDEAIDAGGHCRRPHPNMPGSSVALHDIGAVFNYVFHNRV